MPDNLGLFFKGRTYQPTIRFYNWKRLQVVEFEDIFCSKYFTTLFLLGEVYLGPTVVESIKKNLFLVHFSIASPLKYIFILSFFLSTGTEDSK